MLYYLLATSKEWCKVLGCSYAGTTLIFVVHFTHIYFMIIKKFISASDRRKRNKFLGQLSVDVSDQLQTPCYKPWTYFQKNSGEATSFLSESPFNTL